MDEQQPFAKGRRNRKRILHAAEESFAYHGYKGTSMARISAKTGIPTANIHYYFKNKNLLYAHVLQDVFKEWILEEEEMFLLEGNPAEIIRKYVTSKMLFSRRRPWGSQVWIRSVLHDSGAPDLMDEFANTLKTWVDLRVCLINGWIDQGIMRKIDPKAFLYMIWSTTQHYADFERQIIMLNDGRPFTTTEYNKKTKDVVDLILASCGLVS